MTAEEISKLIRFEEYGLSPNPYAFGYIIRVVFDVPDLDGISWAKNPIFRGMVDGKLNLIAPKSVMLEALALALIDAIPSTPSIPSIPSISSTNPGVQA